jgi:hypothetical protein
MPGGFGYLGGQVVGVDIADTAGGIRSYDEMDARQRSVGDAGGVVQADAVQLAQQDLLDPQPVGREPVAG